MHIELTLDCRDPGRLAVFWSAAAGFTVGESLGDRYLTLSRPGLDLTLQRVGEPKTVKNRMHLDLLVADVDAEVARLLALGAARLAGPRHELGQTWFVLADPEGNEFCVARDPSGR